MSLLIKGMDMPEKCQYCPCCFNNQFEIDFLCGALNKTMSFVRIGRLGDCPLIALPQKHGRLIDADAHIQSLKENQCGERCRKNHDCVNCGIGMYIRIVENEPTVIEAEE